MESFDGRKGKRVSKAIVSDFRFFGFYIGNGTLENSLPEKIDTSIVFEPSDALGNLYAIKLFRNYNRKGEHVRNSELSGASQILVKYLKSLHKKDVTEFEFPFTKEDLADKNDWRAVFARLMLDFGNRRLDTIPLKDFECEDYADDIIDYGGSLERLTALFCNILRMDKDFKVINEDWCRYRVSQYIRMYHDDDYRVKPPFRNWEMELAL